MVLSKRERYIVIATALAVGILLFDWLLLTPMMDRQAALDLERQRVVGELERARVLFARRKQLAPRWQEITAAGLKADPAEAESLVLHALRNWSQEAGLSLSSLRPERVARVGEMQELAFQAVGTGPMDAVAGFLWRIEQSPQPMRIRDMQIGTRKEGTNDLSLQLRLSALCQPPPQPVAAASAARPKESRHD